MVRNTKKPIPVSIAHYAQLLEDLREYTDVMELQLKACMDIADSEYEEIGVTGFDGFEKCVGIIQNQVNWVMKATKAFKEKKRQEQFQAAQAQLKSVAEKKSKYSSTKRKKGMQ